MTAVREERRLVTCMFVDVVGSTELTMQLGAERLKHELGKAFAEISQIIRTHGGTVEKYIGDAIYALFGAPVAHEDDALRAVRAAEALREWCAAGAAHGHPFSIRVGVETGEAVVDLEAAETTKQQMSVGPVVNIAARLQQRAEPGEVLVGPNARRAAGDAVELDGLGETELKGVGRIPVWRLVRVGSYARPVLPFVGREAELGLLTLAYERARKGRSVLAVVSGPPGQGKTRLVQEFLRARDADIQVIAARCRPADEVGVFAPIREILGVQTLDALAEQVGRICTDDIECQRVVAGLAESAGVGADAALAALPAAEREDEIVQSWRRYLGLLGSERLVVLAVDDIHWADATLVRLVDRLTFGGPRVLVVATARPEFADAAGIRPSGDRFFIELEGLEPEEAQRLAREAGASDDRVIARAEGNPLFLVELARSEQDSGDLPLTLQGALGARLDQLAPEDRTLLSLASVAGERFGAADAAFVSGRELADTGRALARLTDLHFLDQSDGGFRFHHGLVREVAYGRLLTAERMKAHARFARERVHPEDAETLAYHWWEALHPPDAEWVWSGDPEVPAMRREAFRAHLAAGARNAHHGLVERGLELLRRALVLADDDVQSAEAETALGVAHRSELKQDESWEHLMKALELRRAAGRVPVELYGELLESALYSGAFRRIPALEEIEAIAVAGVAAGKAAGDQRALARMYRAHAMYLGNTRATEPGVVEQRTRLMDAAVEAADASGHAETIRSVGFGKAALLMGQGHTQEAGRILRDIGRSMDEMSPIGRLQMTRALAIDAWARGDLAELERHVGEAIALAERAGPHHRTHAWQNQADLLELRGEWDAAIELAHRTARLIEAEKASAFCDSAGMILKAGATAHALRGERDEAQWLLRRIPPATPVGVMAAVPRALLGIPSPETDAVFASGRRAWWELFDAAMRALILGLPDEAERAIENLGPAAVEAPTARAFAASVREAIAELRGGPPATYEALSALGFVGWIEVMRRRVDAEY